MSQRVAYFYPLAMVTFSFLPSFVMGLELTFAVV